MAIDIWIINTNDLVAVDARVELLAIPQLVPHTLAAAHVRGAGVAANFLALQPGLAGLFVFDALV